MNKTIEFSIPIPNRELKEGMNLSIENAKNLVNDAEILIKNGRYTTASYLSVVSLEEQGKALILLKKLLNKEDITKEYWADKLEHHEPKIIATYDLVFSKYRHIAIVKRKSQRKRIDSADFAKHILNQKPKNLYVDWDFKTRKTQITDKWEAPSKDVVVKGASLSDNNEDYVLVGDDKRRENSQGLLQEAKFCLACISDYINKQLEAN
jgi:AbiV family abortive infection protein